MQQTPNVCHSELAMLTGQGGTTTTVHASVSIAHAPSCRMVLVRNAKTLTLSAQASKNTSFPILPKHCTVLAKVRSDNLFTRHSMLWHQLLTRWVRVKSWLACSAVWCLCLTLARDAKHCCVNKTELMCPVLCICTLQLTMRMTSLR